MSNILSTMRRIAQETVKSMTPSDNIIGTVVSANPLKVRISEKITLEEVHFYKLKSAVGTYPVYVGNSSGVCKHTLNVGAKVILNRCFGGEKYVILGELID